MRTINEIIVHCTATPDGKDYTVEDITRWHKERGFKTIGYHYVVYRDGSDTRTLEQKDSLVLLLVRLKTQFPMAKIHGHRDFAAKECPSFDATREYEGI